MVGLPTPSGYRFYLTNASRELSPRLVSDLYRVRWEIENDNKLDKSGFRLDDVTAQTGPAVRFVGGCLDCLVDPHQPARPPPSHRPLAP